MIEGGFYLKARRIQESSIMHAPPHVREIWDWLLMKAMFTDGISLQRGQVVTTYSEIQQALSWNIGWRIMKYSRDDCEKAMKWLRKADMVTTTKTTRGVIITICKYDYYQNPKNYENHTEGHRKTTGEPQKFHTIDKNDKKERMKERYLDFVYLTLEEYDKLQKKFNSHLPSILEHMNFKIGQNETAFNKKYKSHYYTILNWNRLGVFSYKQEGESRIL